MIRLAAVGDVHSPDKPRPEVTEAFARAGREADILLLCGDLTRHGRLAQAETLVEELSGVALPVVAVLGNHDFHLDEQEAIASVLLEAGVAVLDGTAVTLDVNGQAVSVAGTKGFCGGFGIRSVPDFGEHVLRLLYSEMVAEASKLEQSLRAADAPVKVAIMHYAPVATTLQGEDQQIWAFLGSSRLAEAIDGAGAAVAFHGHSHYGVERGTTPGGVPVHNVSMPVLKGYYRVYEIGEEEGEAEGAPRTRG